MKVFNGLAAALVSKIATQQAPSCSCPATCTAVGDPHVVDYYGQAWKTADTFIDFYTVNGFSVTGNTHSSGRINEVTFGDETYESTSCTSSSTTFKLYEDLGSYGTINVTLTCFAKNGGWWFDFALAKTDVGNAADFAGMETSYDSSGICQTGPDQSQSSQVTVSGSTFVRVKNNNLRQTATEPSTSSMCSCAAVCTLTGDPHIMDFYDEEKTVTSRGTITLYSVEGFTISGVISDERVRTVQFGTQQTFSSTDCTAVGQTFPGSYTFSDGDIVEIESICEKVSGSDGFFFNIDITKINYAASNSASTFASIEQSLGATGDCENDQQA